MLLEAKSLAGNELGLSSLKMDEYVKLTDEVILEKLITLPETNSDLKAAKKIATDYQDRKLFKCVFERSLSGKNLSKNRLDEIKQKIARKSEINPNQIFIDTSTTSSIPLTPSKKESKSIILTRKEAKNTVAKEIPISDIPLVSSMSKVMNILRVYTPASYRRKIEIAAKSMERELK